MNFATKEKECQVAFEPTEDEHEIFKHAFTIQVDEHRSGKLTLEDRPYTYYLAYLSFGDVIIQAESEVGMHPLGFIDMAKALEYAVAHRRFGPNEVWLASEMAEEMTDYAVAFVENRAEAEVNRLIGDLINPVSQD
ncbi:MAG: hypothetical protein JWO41_800 [Candidatus Saccharibacteria bacterium]|nr:hypothetical protein [Candidatus Saccharibacteria bacterium]